MREAFSPAGTAIEALMLAACNGVLDLVRNRIHVEGKAADGSDIGQYEHGGMVTLTGTGVLRDELTVIASGNQFGLGWAAGGGKNQRISMYGLALALEEKYGKRIWALSDSERKEAMQAAQMAANEYLRNALS